MKKLFTIFIISTVAIGACRKDMSTSNNFIQYTNAGINDTTWVNHPSANPLNDSLVNVFTVPNVYEDTFMLSTGRSFQFLGDDSLFLNFPAQCCVNPVTNSVIPNGNIHFQISVLKSKGDFVRALIPTTSKSTIIKANKVFNVRTLLNGQEVNIAPAAPLTLSWLDRNAIADTKFYAGTPLSNPDSSFTFLPVSNTVGNIQVIDYPSTSIVKGYQLTSSITHIFGAFNSVDTSNGTSRLNILLPPNFTNKNTVVFAVFQNSPVVIRLSSDYATRTYFATCIPMNILLNVVAISKIDKEFYFAESSFIFNNSNAVKLSPQEKSVQNINKALDNL